MSEIFEYYNPNPTYRPFSNGKNKQWTLDDSSVRVISAIKDISWEEAFDKLSHVSKNIHNMPHSKKTMESILAEYGYEYCTLGKPTKDARRITVKEFVDTHQTGIYILYLASRFVAIVDGKIKDTDDLSNSVVYSYWTR